MENTNQSALFEIYVGSIEAMNMAAQDGVKGLSSRTMRWHTVSKTARYHVIPDAKIKGGASLFCNQDLRVIAEQRGLIL